jgi:hypothetical protein
MSPEKSIYDIETPKIVPGTYGEVDILLIQNDTSYLLERQGIPWMCTDIDCLYAKDTSYSQYDLAYGNVLVTGLGFGILAKALSEKPEVDSVTVIEIEQDVIDAFLSHNTLNSKVSIIKGDATTYTSDLKYDCLLPDHYESQSMSWRIKDMNAISDRVKHDVFWPWSIEEIFLDHTYPRHQYTASEQNKSTYSLESITKENSSILYSKWQSFIDKNFKGNQSLLSISPDILAIYIEKFAKYYYTTTPVNIY